MSKPRLQDVLDTLKIATAAAINADPETAIYGGQVTTGQPIQSELQKILEKQHYVVSIFDHAPARNTTRFADEEETLVLPPAPLVATIAGNTVTLSGFATAGLNVWTFVGGLVQAVFIQTIAGQQLPDVAAAIAAAVNAAEIAGVTATASGTQVTIVGSPQLLCRITTTGPVKAKEVKRTQRSVDVAVWASDPVARGTIASAIESGVATTDVTFLALSDGTGLSVFPATDLPVDKGQSSYSLYEHHFIFMLEYGVYRICQGTVVGAVRASITRTPGDAPPMVVTS